MCPGGWYRGRECSTVRGAVYCEGPCGHALPFESAIIPAHGAGPKPGVQDADVSMHTDCCRCCTIPLEWSKPQNHLCGSASVHSLVPDCASTVTSPTDNAVTQLTTGRLDWCSRHYFKHNSKTPGHYIAFRVMWTVKIFSKVYVS